MQLTVGENLPVHGSVGQGAELHQPLPHGRAAVKFPAGRPSGGAAPTSTRGGHAVGNAWIHGIKMSLNSHLVCPSPASGCPAPP